MIVKFRYLKSEKLPPIHPGKLLVENLFEPRGLTTKVVEDIHVPKKELENLLAEKSNLTTDLACRLGLYF